jgi:hypothetical protein
MILTLKGDNLYFEYTFNTPHTRLEKTKECRTFTTHWAELRPWNKR